MKKATPRPARAAGTATPKRPPKPAKPASPTAKERVEMRRSADREEFMPGLGSKTKFARKYGDGEFHSVTTGRRKQVGDAMTERYERDSKLADTYGQDAYKDKSFMRSVPGSAVVRKAMGGMCRGMGAASKGGKYKA